MVWSDGLPGVRAERLAQRVGHRLDVGGDQRQRVEERLDALRVDDVA